MSEDVKQIYVDGISSMNFLNGMVRIGMGTMVPTNSDDPNVKPTFNEEYRLIIPLNGFLAGFNSQKEMIDRLEQGGVISRTEEQEKTVSEVIPDVK